MEADRPDNLFQGRFRGKLQQRSIDCLADLQILLPALLMKETGEISCFPKSVPDLQPKS